MSAGKIEVGTINSVRGYLGKPGSGKTVLALTHMQEWIPRAYILAVDHNGNMPLHFPRGVQGGRPTHVRRFKSIAQVRDAIATDPRGILAIQEPAQVVVPFANELASATMEENERGDRFGVPVLLYVDEVVFWREVNKQKIGETAEILLTNRRHQNLLFWYGSQYPGLVHYTLILQASDVYLFRMDGEQDLKRLKQGGIGAEVLRQLPSLAPYEAIHVEKL